MESSQAVFTELVEPHRPELRAHCRRLLGSADDAEDALQEALLRAWKALPRLEGPESVRPWLYAIATNTSLDAIKRRRKWLLPLDPDGAAETLRSVGVEDKRTVPHDRYERRESARLAAAAAVALLPSRQREALLLREVLGFSARETADLLGASVASVNSALQRARATLGALPEPATLEAEILDDEEVREIAERCADACERDDVEQVVSLLAETRVPVSGGRCRRRASSGAG